MSDLCDDFEFLEIPDDSDESLARVKAVLEKLNKPFDVISIFIDSRHGSISVEPDLRNITSPELKHIFCPSSMILSNEDCDNAEKGCCNKTQLFNGTIEECLSFTQQLCKLFPKTPIRYTFHFLELVDETMESFVTKCLVENYDKVTFWGSFREPLTHDEVDFLMNMVKPEAYLELNSEVPHGYRHEKAFQFRSFFYHHAHWITLDDLKSLRNRNVVRLGRTRLINEDINRLLLYWTNCTEDMMNKFSAHLRPEVACDKKIILKNLKSVTRRREGAGHRVCYIKSNETSAMGELIIHPTVIEFNVIPSSNRNYGQLNQILMEIDTKRDLIAERGLNLEESNGCKEIIHLYRHEEQTNLLDEIERLDERRKEIDSVLQCISSKWWRLGFQDSEQ